MALFNVRNVFTWKLWDWVEALLDYVNADILCWQECGQPSNLDHGTFEVKVEGTRGGQVCMEIGWQMKIVRVEGSDWGQTVAHDGGGWGNRNRICFNVYTPMERPQVSAL